MRLSTIGLAGVLLTAACSSDEAGEEKAPVEVIERTKLRGYHSGVIPPIAEEVAQNFTYHVDAQHGEEPVKEGVFYNRLEGCDGFTVHKVVGPKDDQSLQMVLYIGDDCDTQLVRQNSTMVGAVSQTQSAFGLDFAMQDNYGIEVILWKGEKNGFCYNEYTLANSTLFTPQNVKGCGAELTNRFDAGVERFKDILYLNDHISVWHQENRERGMKMEPHPAYKAFE